MGELYEVRRIIRVGLQLSDSMVKYQEAQREREPKLRTSEIIGRIQIATTMVGAYPWPIWYTFRPMGRDLFKRLSYVSNREQFLDANLVVIRDQERAGLDIVADPRLWYDELFGGWTAGVADRIEGIEWRPTDSEWTHPAYVTPVTMDVARNEGYYAITRKVSDGGLGWARIYSLIAQLTKKPIKFGMIDPGSLVRLTRNTYYKDSKEAVIDLAKIYNSELKRLVDAGCKIIQLDEPFGGARSVLNTKDEWPFMIETFNKTVEGLSGKASIWAHMCWAGTAGQTVRYPYPKWDHLFPYVLETDLDVIEIEQASAGGVDLQLFKEYASDKEVGIGVVSHRMIRVETAEEVAKLVEEASKYVDPYKLLLTTDCGLGRQSLPRFQAYHKIRAIAEGAALVRKKLR